MKNRSNFQLPSDRLPPQNIEAEEAILGGILLDPEAISRVAELLDPSCFTILAHQAIYRTTLNLHLQGKPTDLMTVTTWLADHNQLEEVGGQMKLAQLVDRTVSAVNIDQYALLVIEKAMRRNLIKAGHETIDLGYDTTVDIEEVLDQAEQQIFNITQVRPQQNLVSIAETLINTFQDIEDRHEGVALPGLNCDFYDLDAMTGGFQRSDLIIVAGRPSMGKTALCTNISYSIAKIHKLPVAIFSLEMSKEQLVQRLLSSEAKIESNRLRSGRISQSEWEPLTIAIGTLSELPVFIDDTPNITVTEMRSKVRRLQAEQGGAMGLVLIDYLQLMEGGSDNRVQELSRITRSLKGLARELNVPVIALSQLSRSVESRTNKRPMMSDLRESGCLTGDSLITLADTGLQVPIKELVGKSGFSVSALNTKTMKLETAIVSNAFSTGTKPVFRLTTRLGRTIQATGNHQFLTVHGWQRLDELSCGCPIAVPKCLASYDLQLMSDAELGFLDERTGKLAQVVKSKTVALLANRDIYWDEIVAIEPIGETEVYDLTVSGLHNFIANNIIVHNSIEQDADLVIMLYRDDYYNPDSPDRGIAEVIITKHRNGPTGTIKLLFDPQFTKFRNLAGGDRYFPAAQSNPLPPAH
ncbi:replicative DNA helicase [Lyngbya aestuarii BL J]|uniref:Replicative DNA helicase n=2 Tax=Lyngbya aestuarii BL J TaxID=1348334 RepID=U7QFB4_9CYAN|nr:replicative DNA helicase [Lyngbya aestuarii]ERT06639.1 replicative DNA helicase [Lyngbya aestuarii BL J]